MTTAQKEQHAREGPPPCLLMATAQGPHAREGPPPLLLGAGQQPVLAGAAGVAANGPRGVPPAGGVMSVDEADERVGAGEEEPALAGSSKQGGHGHECGEKRRKCEHKNPGTARVLQLHTLQVRWLGALLPWLRALHLLPLPPLCEFIHALIHPMPRPETSLPCFVTFIYGCPALPPSPTLINSKMCRPTPPRAPVPPRSYPMQL